MASNKPTQTSTDTSMDHQELGYYKQNVLVKHINKHNTRTQVSASLYQFI